MSERHLSHCRPTVVSTSSAAIPKPASPGWQPIVREQMNPYRKAARPEERKPHVSMTFRFSEVAITLLSLAGQEWGRS
ncbi:hypothetical protein [Nonomuraea sp. NPDC049400]|uniref:hypothetical protein n=1 Tax=Nonomuraea sp. NPDC049400 TaxID=3364352 RepID=UPI0037AD41C1